MESTNRQTRPQNKETKTVSLFFTFVPCDPSANQRTMEVEKLFVVFVFFCVTNIAGQLYIHRGESINQFRCYALVIDSRANTHTHTHAHTHTYEPWNRKKKNSFTKKANECRKSVEEERESKRQESLQDEKYTPSVCMCVCVENVG